MLFAIKKERNHVIGAVILEKDYVSDNPNFDYAYKFGDLIERLKEHMVKYPNETFYVFIGYEVFAPNEYGRMDLCGKESLEERKIVIKNGEIVEGKVKKEVTK